MTRKNGIGIEKKIFFGGGGGVDKPVLDLEKLAFRVAKNGFIEIEKKTGCGIGKLFWG